MTAVENNVTATNQVVESTETEDGITLMDLFRIVRKHILWGYHHVRGGIRRSVRIHIPSTPEVFGNRAGVRNLQ